MSGPRGVRTEFADIFDTRGRAGAMTRLPETAGGIRCYRGARALRSRQNKGFIVDESHSGFGRPLRRSGVLKTPRNTPTESRSFSA